MTVCYAVYVEKESVGKRVKSSKVKILWQIAFEEDLVVHQIELRHSIVSGKREVLFDNQPVYSNKALFQGTFEHRSKLAGHEVRVTVEDTFEGYVYDLVVDNVMFHRMPRKSLQELEVLRNEKKNAPTVQTDFASFTGKSKSALDGSSSPKKEKRTEQPRKEESLIDLDWDAAVRVQAPQPASVSARPPQPQYNPFESSTFVQQTHTQVGGYDPFSQPSSYGYAAPSSIPVQQPSFNASYQAPQQSYYGAPQAQPPYDPFSSYASPQYTPPPQQYSPPPQQYAVPPPSQYGQPPQQQAQRYDPFGAF